MRGAVGSEEWGESPLNLARLPQIARARSLSKYNVFGVMIEANTCYAPLHLEPI